MKYIKGFDALRAFSIILVLLTHIGLYEILPDNNYLKTRGWNLMSGTTGVQLFFTLSGFLITSILLEEKNKNGFINFKNFYIRRFLRLLPPLIVFYLIVAACMQFRLIHTTSIGLICSFFYVYNFVPNQYYTAELGHTWSLAVEEQFYLTWPLVVNFIKNKKTVYFIVTLIILSCIAAVLILPVTTFAVNFRTGYWFIPAVAPIIIGSLFAYLNRNQFQNLNLQILNSNKLLLIAFVLFIFPLYSPLFLLKFAFLSQSVAASLFLIWVLHNQDKKLTNIIDHKVPQYIGKISYGLYVYQGFFLRTGPGGNLSVQQFPLNLALTFLVAIISYEFIEKPVLKLKHKFY